MRMASESSEALLGPKKGGTLVRLEYANPQRYLVEYRQPLPQIAPDMTTDTYPWMLVNWPFLDRVEEIVNILRERDLNPAGWFDINGYTTAARYLYPYSTIDEQNFDTWGWYAVSRLAVNGAGESGRVLLFDPSYLADQASYDAIYQAKKAVRQQLGSITFLVRAGDDELITDYRSCHTPDYENIAYELTIMRHFVAAPLNQSASSFATNGKHGNTLTSEPRLGEHALEQEAILRENLPVIQVRDAPLLLLIIGPSGVGKDSIITPLIQDGTANESRAATSRARRTENEEPPDKYVWMRARRPDESRAAYQQALTEEYGLVESAYHNGNIYGLPAPSLENALSTHNVTLIVTDNAAVKRIQELACGAATCVSIFVLPDSLDVLERHVSQLDNAHERMAEAIAMVTEAPSVANYFLVNSRANGGLAAANNALRSVIDRHWRKNSNE